MVGVRAVGVDEHECAVRVGPRQRIGDVLRDLRVQMLGLEVEPHRELHALARTAQGDGDEAVARVEAEQVRHRRDDVVEGGDLDDLGLAGCAHPDTVVMWLRHRERRQLRCGPRSARVDESSGE